MGLSLGRSFRAVVFWRIGDAANDTTWVQPSEAPAEQPASQWGSVSRQVEVVAGEVAVELGPGGGQTGEGVGDSEVWGSAEGDGASGHIGGWDKQVTGVWPGHGNGGGGDWNMSEWPLQAPNTSRPEVYAEWRRSLKYDVDTGLPANSKTFLKVMARLGLYINSVDVTENGDHLALNLKRSGHGGVHNFYPADQRIVIGQSNVQKKEAVWYLI